MDPTEGQMFMLVEYLLNRKLLVSCYIQISLEQGSVFSRNIVFEKSSLGSLISTFQPPITSQPPLGATMPISWERRISCTAFSVLAYFLPLFGCSSCEIARVERVLLPYPRQTPYHLLAIPQGPPALPRAPFLAPRQPPTTSAPSPSSMTATGSTSSSTTMSNSSCTRWTTRSTVLLNIRVLLRMITCMASIRSLAGIDQRVRVLQVVKVSSG